MKICFYQIITTVICKPDVTSLSPSSAGFSSHEGITLETLAFQIFHGGSSIGINSFDKTTFCKQNNIENSCCTSLISMQIIQSSVVQKIRLESWR